MRPVSPDRRAALVIAHPGHELSVYCWLSLVRPSVFVFTDGSGQSHQSRLHRTTGILNSCGARPGTIYGRLRDAEIYLAILNGDVDLFINLARELAEALVRDRVEYVVADAIEGYNPAHDLCRLVTNAAVKLSCRMGNCVENFDLPLAHKPANHPPAGMAGAMRIDADEQMLSQKLQAARDYSELAVDVNRIVEREGIDKLRIEYLRPVSEDSSNGVTWDHPYYEVYGAEQVAAGYYAQVIRYREHVLPLSDALRQYAER